MPFTLDPRLEPYATKRQWEILKALETHGSERRAAKALEIHKRRFNAVKSAVVSNAAQNGYAPDFDMVHPSPPGFHVKGASTLYDMQTGDPKLQWVKTDLDKEAQENAMREAVEAMCEDIKPVTPKPAPKNTHADLLNEYVITDFHFGMLAWHQEGGADWDLKIAEKTLVGCFSQMMAQAPEAETAIICQLGDFLHTDYPALNALTPQSGHFLDADGRPHKVIKAAIRVLRTIIDMALTKHKKVHVLMAEGNHDMVSSIWLQMMFATLYENEKRVTVEESPLPFYAYKHGETALFYHHGHQRKPQQLPGVFAAQFPKIWGDTTKRYAKCGHMHHRIVINEKEDNGVTVTQVPTLAAKDAHSSRGAYYAERKTDCDTYHKKHGRVGSVYVTPEMAA